MTLRSKQIFSRGIEVMPGGVSSPVRAFKGVFGTPLVFDRGEGHLLFDADGKSYTDYVQSWGPLILGHAHKSVIESVSAAVKNGLSFGATCTLEVELAELIVGMFDSIEQIRFVNSGTEATMSALRLARGYTGREKIIKFSGGFHGHSDMLLAKAGSGVATLGIPDSAGVPAALAQNTLTAPYNDIDATTKLFSSNEGQIAAVIVEPIAGNMGFVRPKPEFLEGLRALCDRHGALLIFDEVMTGFRAALPGAQTLFNIRPDITCLGKVIGGGLPVGAYGASKEIMSQVAPLGPVYQSGTLCGNPIGMAAGLSTLKTLMQPAVFDSISYETVRLMKGMKEIADRFLVPLQTDYCGTMFGFFMLKSEKDSVFDFESAKQNVDTKAYARLFHEVLDKGIYFAPSPFEVGFMSVSHSDKVVDETLTVIESVFKKWRV